MSMPVLAAMEPNDWPDLTIQNIGPGGFGLGAGRLGGARHRLRRSPGASASGLTVGL
jgi:hypothetical protein